MTAPRWLYLAWLLALVCVALMNRPFTIVARPELKVVAVRRAEVPRG